MQPSAASGPGWGNNAYLRPLGGSRSLLPRPRRTGMETSNLDPDRPALRTGLLIDSFTQPAWVHRALELVVAQGMMTPVLAILNTAPRDPSNHGSSRIGTYWKNRSLLGYAAYSKIDRWRYGRPEDPGAPVDIGPLVGGVAVLHVAPERTKVSDRFPTAAVDHVRSHDLDVLLRLGFRILRGPILSAARFGTWSYHHGDNRRYRGGPACFWEVLEGSPVTGTILQRLTEELDGGEVLYRSTGATNRFSPTVNRREVYWKSAEFLVRVARHVRETGRLESPQAAEGQAPAAYSQRLYVAPGNGQMLLGATRIATRLVASKLQSLARKPQWGLAFHRRPGVPEGNREPYLVPHRFKMITPPPDRFWADPFPVQVKGTDFILFEELIYSERRGRISILELGPNGPIGPATPVLRADHHLSYPFVFQWRGEHFMMPESSAAGCIQLYRARTFPHEWALETNLLEGLPLLDATLAQVEGRWWLWGNLQAPGASPWDEVHLFYAPTPLGPWTPHRANPVVSDVRTARPAGGPFSRHGAWFRPSQDCSRGYGSALNIQRILRLTEREYEEQTVARLAPEWIPGIRGIHTVNAAGGLTVIDILHSGRRRR